MNEFWGEGNFAISVSGLEAAPDRGLIRLLATELCSSIRSANLRVRCEGIGSLRQRSLRECLLLDALREQRGFLGVMSRGSHILSLPGKLEWHAIFTYGFPILWRCFPYDVVGQLATLRVKTLHAEFPDDPRLGSSGGRNYIGSGE